MVTCAAVGVGLVVVEVAIVVAAAVEAVVKEVAVVSFNLEM